MTDIPDRALIYVTDPMCSWCWGFAPVLRALIDQTGLPVEVMLGGLAAGPSARSMTPEVRAELTEQWSTVERQTQQSFNTTALDERPADWRYDTLVPCMSVVAVRAQAPSSALDAVEALQKAFYLQGQDITDASVCADVLSALVPDPSQLRDDLNSDALVEATVQEFASARELGVAGFPTVIVRAGNEWALAAQGWAPEGALIPGLRAWLAERS